MGRSRRNVIVMNSASNALPLRHHLTNLLLYSFRPRTIN